MRTILAATTLLLAASGSALAQPTITSLGSGVPISVSNLTSGSHFVGGSGLTSVQAARWTFNGVTLSGIEIGGNGGGHISSDGLFQAGHILNTTPQILGNTAATVTPAYSPTPTLVPSTTLPGTNEFAAHRWSSATSMWTSMGGLPINGALQTFGSGSNGANNTFLTANAISANGRFTVGLGYISGFNNAGTSISANSFRWRAWVWDANSNSMTVLPTPFRTSSNPGLRRTANAYAVSDDGNVIVGAQEHNVGTTPTADPDGGRPVVWRMNTVTNQYEMTYLPNGVNGSGFPYTYSTTPGSMAMNAAGTIIAGRAADSAGVLSIVKWVWNSGTSTWDAPIVIGNALSAPASWLPASVTGCGVPPTLGGSLAMSDDGNTIVGSAVYSTCGSFMSGGFIWTAASGLIRD